MAQSKQVTFEFDHAGQGSKDTDSYTIKQLKNVASIHVANGGDRNESERGAGDIVNLGQIKQFQRDNSKTNVVVNRASR